MPRRELLSQSQKLELLAIPDDEGEFIRFYTLSEHDLAQIRRQRLKHNRLGFAMQLCYLRYPGQVLGPDADVDPRLLSFVSQQLNIDDDSWEDYGRRDQTRREHLVAIMDTYGYQQFSTAHYREFAEWLLPLAMQTEQGIILAQTVLDKIRSHKIIAPPLAVVDRLCSETATRAVRNIYRLLTEPLTESHRQEMDRLLSQHEQKKSVNILTWLRQPVGAPSARHVLGLIERLRLIRNLQLPAGLEKTIHQNRFMKLARMAGQTSVQHLRRFDDEQRHAMIVALLLETRATLTDEIIAMHDKIMGTMFARAKRKYQEKFAESAKELNEKIRLYFRIGEALLAARREGSDPFAAIEAIVDWKDFEASISEAQQMASSADDDSLGLIGAWYPQVRRYAPIFLDTFDFHAAPVAENLLSAVNLLRNLNDSQTRFIPDDAPTSFIRKRWLPFVKTENGLDRRYYEMCVLSELKNALRSGDLWVSGSRQFKDFADYLIPQDIYSDIKKTGLPLPVEQDGKLYIDGRLEQLGFELKKVNDLAAKGILPDVSISDGSLKISPITNSVPEEVASEMRRVYALLPHVRITELLLEVDQWTGFSQNFTHLKTGEPSDEQSLLLTAILADGINLGLTKMAEACPEATYAKLSWLAAWHIRDETYSKALAELVNVQHQQPLAAYWGEGTTSSSDGQRYRAGGRGEPSGQVNLKYGTDPSVMVYTHISDRYAPFHSKVINATVRDATHVLDGLLYHESDIKIEEHYTDTAGFTDHVFGLCHLLGFRFAPRIRDLSDKRLYIPSKADDLQTLTGLIGGTIQHGHLLSHWDEILRLATSIRQGTVTASLMLKKLGNYPRQNGLALALREVGRIERSLFMLQWLQDPELRRRVQVGLNKGEARNALARAVFFNRLGEMRDRTFEHQNYRASGLNLLVAAIILWNTVYLERAIDALKKKGAPVSEELIANFSPLAWEHINLTGDYVWKLNRRVSQGQFRPLQKA